MRNYMSEKLKRFTIVFVFFVLFQACDRCNKIYSFISVVRAPLSITV